MRSGLILTLLGLLLHGQTILVNGTGDGSFEGGTGCTGNSYTVNGWTIVNGTQTNRWAVNTGAGATHGSRAIYITNNCAGSPPPHQYTISSASSVVHFYRDVTLPPGEPYLQFSFSLIVQGEGTSTQYDYLDIFVAPTSVTPTAGTEVSATYRVARYNLQSSTWVVRSFTNCTPRTGTVRVIFSWRNDGSVGTQPPAALDQIHITSTATAPPCNLGSGVTNIGPLGAGTWNSGAGTTCGAGNDLTSGNTVACGSTSYLGGEDRVFAFTPTVSGTVTISLTHSNASSPWFGLMLYAGCPTCGECLAHSQSGSGPYNLCTPVTAGTTYYLVVDHFPAPNCAAYDNISITLAPPPPPPDLCGTPLFDTYPVLTSGTTAGAPSLGVTPGCVSGSSCGGSIPGRWYRFVATAANMTVHVSPGSLTDPAVAVFSAPSCSGPFTQIACNDNGTGCESFPRFARLDLTGLTVGQVYYVAVFAGADGGSGDYTLAIWPTAGSPPTQYGQDCDAVPGNPATGPIIPCGATMSFGAPGFVGPGIVCDLPHPAGGCPASCLTSGERNIVWFRLPIAANGNLSFAITPSSNVDYDWILYRIDNVANPCNDIRTGAINPVRCSYAAPTSCDGTYGTGVACGTPGCASGTCEGAGGEGWLSCVSVNAGEVYLLGISNFSTTTFPGFSVNFGTSPIAYQPNPSIWTGGAGTTAWNNATNWGSCGVPNACTQDVFIYGGSSNQPVIAAAETWTVRDITIPAGASLTVNGTLRICGHLTVNGMLNGTGWVEFVGNATYPVQEIRGILAGGPYIPNLRLQRTANGTVRLMTDVQTGNVDITNSATHTLDFNGNVLYVSGDFTNQTTGNTVQATSTGSTLVFNGSSAQTYSDPGSDPFLNVTVNQSAVSTVTLNNTLRITGTLTLTKGLLVAPVAVSREVRVENTAPAAVNAGNANSFVAGFLRRYLNNTGGSYDFPVGLQTPQRYSRINFNFSGNPGVHNLLARFDAWTPPTPSGTPIAECGANYGTCPMLNNGYWTVNAYQSDLTTQITGTSGTYTATLYNTGYTTCTGAAQFGVLKNTSASATTGANWFIQNPGCHANTSAATVSRPGMSGFSFFGTGQSTSPLPIVLVDFRGRVLPDGSHELSWIVNATAGSRVRHYVLEAGTEPGSLLPLATLGPEETVYRRLSPPFGRSFYRLRIHAEDGTELYSSVVELERKSASMAEHLDISIYPNPAREEVHVSWRTDGIDPIGIRLYNSLGQAVSEVTIPQPQAMGTHTFSLRPLSKGLYLVEVRQGERLSLVRLVVE